MDVLINIVIVAIILVGLVLIHEVGHFVMARRAGVTVHEFGIGFPPRAAVLYRGKETTYTLNWLPIGGFVRLEGEEGESLDPRAFVNQRMGTRLRILCAGVAINFLLAWLIFTLIAMFADPVTNVRIGEVLPDSPAARAGLVGGKVIGQTEPVALIDASGNPTGETMRFPIYDDSGDLIVAINGNRFPVFDALTAANVNGNNRPAPLRYLDEHAGQRVRLTVRHPDGRIEDLDVTLMDLPRATLGISAPVPLPKDDSTNPPIDAIAMGLRRTAEASTLILGGVADTLGSIVDGGAPPVTGPVGMTSIVGEVRTALPPVFLVWFVGLLSANLAIVNALPLPPLDGGRVTMALVQALSRDRLSPLVERTASVTGFVLLMALLAWVTIADVQGPIG